MKKSSLIFSVLIAFVFFACGGGEEEKADKKQLRINTNKSETTATNQASDLLASKTIDLTNKGVGPVSSVTLGESIDQDMVAKGKEAYDQLCLACHRVGKKFIGPAPNGILERRTPEWVMNMMLDPEGMVKNDPLAKALLIEYNGSPMANQNLTEEQARSILEYFRTLK